MILPMRITPAQLRQIVQKEEAASGKGAVRLTRQEAERWCLAHLGNNWHLLPVILMVKGYNEDYANFTEVDPESVYELKQVGCFVNLPPWWTSFELWVRDSACVCGHSAVDHDLRFDEACWFDGGRCDCSQYRPASART